MPRKSSVFFTLIALIALGAAIFIGRYFLMDAQQANMKDIVQAQDLYTKKVQPIFNAKCIACHSCYNSPCQLNLTSYDGLVRGGHKLNIYDFPKVEARQPTRIGVDATTTEGWRDLDFFTVTGQGEQNLLSYMISTPPGIESGLQDKYDAEYSRACITSTDESELKAFTKLNPAGRMPLGFPKLEDSEIKTLNDWIANQEQGPTQKDIEAKILSHAPVVENVKSWEEFLNNKALKNKITSRYLYEHLFLANIYFEGLPNLFFKLVRSSSQYGEIQEIATALPFDDPGDKFFYRIQPYSRTIVHKNNIPFKLSHSTLEHWKKLFIETDWRKETINLPAYGNSGANPFTTFASMPAQSRYQFFLENSQYFIMTFIKGPVCRGQTALNVINDHFWVLFLDPSVDPLSQSQKTYDKVASETQFPSEIGDDFDPFLEFKDKYWKSVQTKFAYLKSAGPLEMDSLWNGDKKNPNAAITVFRHFDSANVLYGLRGQSPKTVWVFDYHVFESVYYNLSAGYNVFGPLLHQLNSRLYMEVSRVASEDLFISFLPQKVRNSIRNEWNAPTPERKKSALQEIAEVFTESAKEKFHGNYVFQGGNIKSKISLDIDNSKEEFLQLLSDKHFSESQINRDTLKGALKDLSRLSAKSVMHLPDTLFLFLEDVGDRGELWTLIHNKDHYNVGMILFEQDRRRPDKDSMDVIRGAASSYANIIVSLKSSQIAEFASDLKNSESSAQVWKVLTKYGLSRSDKNFWEVYNRVSASTYNEQTNERGYLDLNRYLNL